ncbi:hypothetical protein HZA39_00670 [Candidatus Peregrinibacteria bacterium]|nr:hypothetical protein [Candidatus Peregrinibacteria bacterium]
MIDKLKTGEVTKEEAKEEIKCCVERVFPLMQETEKYFDFRGVEIPGRDALSKSMKSTTFYDKNDEKWGLLIHNISAKPSDLRKGCGDMGVSGAQIQHQQYIMLGQPPSSINDVKYSLNEKIPAYFSISREVSSDGKIKYNLTSITDGKLDTQFTETDDPEKDVYHTLDNLQERLLKFESQLNDIIQSKKKLLGDFAPEKGGG